MRMVVLGGAGAMGRWTVRDLTESDGVEQVVVADRDGGAAREAAGWAAARSGTKGSAEVSALALDAADGAALRRALEGAQVACNCAHHGLSLAVMEACADVGTHYVDLGGLFHTTRRQLALAGRFREAGVTAVLGMGGSPGTTNVMAARAARDLARVDEVAVRLGIADFGTSPAPLPIPYAVRTLLDEFTVPAMVFTAGGWCEVAAMSEPEQLEFPAPVGRVTVGHTLHSEVATLPLHFADRGIREVSFKVGFPAAFMAGMQLLASLGLAATEPVTVGDQRVVPRELLIRCLEDQPAAAPDAEPDDAEAIWVVVRGASADGSPVEVLAECVVLPHRRWQAGAGQLDTGAPASIVAQFLAGGLIDTPGVFAAEDVVPPDPYFAELADRSMVVELVTRTRATSRREQA